MIAYDVDSNAITLREKTPFWAWAIQKGIFVTSDQHKNGEMYTSSQPWR